MSFLLSRQSCRLLAFLVVLAASAPNVARSQEAATSQEAAAETNSTLRDVVKPQENAVPEKDAETAPAEPTRAEPTKAEADAVAEAVPEPATELPLDKGTSVDADYALLGEFAGQMTSGVDGDKDGQTQKLGLQIRPIGGENFEALRYNGGLPGAGATTAADPVPLVGRRSGDMMVLSGAEQAIFVSKDDCTIVDRTGKLLGTLQRVQRGSPTMGAAPPEGAVVLFDGTNTDQFTTAQMTAEGLLMEGAEVKPMFQDFNLHVEFRLPYMPNDDSQARGNSGCYLQSRYEIQVLDSFGQLPQFNGCSSIYRFKSPDVNMCLPPLVWQTYDIMFTAPRWAADGSKIRNARVTVWQNGVKTQDDVELPNKTGAGKPEEPNLLPTKFQNHKDPVRFRNIWIVDRGLAPGEFPVLASEVDGASETKADAPVSDQSDSSGDDKNDQ